MADAGDYRLEMLVTAQRLKVLDSLTYEDEDIQEAAQVPKMMTNRRKEITVRPTGDDKVDGLLLKVMVKHSCFMFVEKACKQK